MGDEKKAEQPTLIGTMWAVGEWIVRREALMRLSAVVVMVGAGGVGVVYAQRLQDAGVAPVRADVRAVRAELVRHIETADDRFEELAKDLAAVNRRLDAKEERDAARFDLLYRTVLTGRPQPGADALASPRMDGGL